MIASNSREHPVGMVAGDEDILKCYIILDTSPRKTFVYTFH
jgi:hypothetical protein